MCQTTVWWYAYWEINFVKLAKISMKTVIGFILNIPIGKVKGTFISKPAVTKTSIITNNCNGHPMKQHKFNND